MTINGNQRAEYLKALRKAARLTLHEVGEEFGMSHEQIRNYENGTTPIGEDEFVELIATINRCRRQVDTEYRDVLASLRGKIPEPVGG